MRRGLMAWDASELPLATLQARIETLRSAMRTSGLDGLIAYTNISRPSAVNWISGFTPYWSEGVFLLPLKGDPVFATALSKRVAEWIGSVMPVGTVIPTPQPGVAIGKKIAEEQLKKLGVVGLDDLPAPQARGLIDNAPGLILSDATALFDAARAPSDQAEKYLFTKAAQMAQDSMIHAAQFWPDARQMIATCEEQARLAGAEDIFLSIAPDIASSATFQRTDTLTSIRSSAALRIALAYKGVWVRLTRSFSEIPAAQELFASLQQKFDALQLTATSEIAATLQAQFASRNTEIIDWKIEQPRGAYPLVTVASSAAAADLFAPAAPYVLSVEIEAASTRWLAARPVRTW